MTENWYQNRSISANQPDGATGCASPKVQVAPLPIAPVTGGGREDRRRERRFAVNDRGWIRVLDPLCEKRIDATIVDVSQSGIKLGLGVYLPVGTTVQVHLPGAIALGEVRHCKASKGNFFAGLRLSDVCFTGPRRDVRQETRYPVNVPGSLRTEGSPTVTHEIIVLDVSKSGLRIRCSETIPNGTHVDIECSGAMIPGEIRYVRPVHQGEFHMGILAHSAKPGGAPNEALNLILLFYPEVTF